MRCRAGYTEIIVESRYSSETNHRGVRHIFPIEGQPYSAHLFVECSRRMTDDYKVGTRFKICVIPKRKLGGRDFLYAYHGDPFEKLG